MKKILLCVVALLPLTAQAGRITLQLTEQTETANGTLCRYSNSIYDFIYKTNSKHCPSVKTFDNEK
ncbi:TPA: hypothetical protein MD191_004485 [Klebsiella pneumoniae]|uniref:hypothetical protein n=1 Tax=Klebsiella pneumoniae TaxID=573 RepID=UPI000E2DDA14|nr:hypothetical protein [Klebsiella pneumoniae]SVL91773.1 Uncharacterised protein [Klebsiella pneumoniae]HBV5776107.1 hypothetical protein [Klebsiella pneumoniae]HBY5417037.1 hypothetical protein [Klebsiella pneumoniae]